MWLGTMSSTIAQPGARSALGQHAPAVLAAALRVDGAVVDDVVAVVEPVVAAQQRRQVQRGDAERGQVVGQPGGACRSNAGRTCTR